MVAILDKLPVISVIKLVAIHQLDDDGFFTIDAGQHDYNNYNYNFRELRDFFSVNGIEDTIWIHASIFEDGTYGDYRIPFKPEHKKFFDDNKELINSLIAKFVNGN